MNWFKSFLKAASTPLPRGGRARILNNFSPRSQQALALARKEAERFNHNFVGTEHLLLGLISLGHGTAVTVLGKMGASLETVRREVERQIGRGPDQQMIGLIPYTPRVKKALALAAKEAGQLNHTHVGTEHILLGLLREGDGVAARVLANLGINVEETRIAILNELNPHSQAAPAEIATMPQTAESPTPSPNPFDISRRYDVYCTEQHQQVVYRNALFKGAKRLFLKGEDGILCEFIELEQANGQTIFIAGHSLIKFCEHGVTPGSEAVSDPPN